MEDRYREILRNSRARDAAAGRTLDGPHLTDLQVIYAPKGMPARDASTGEQKALLIGLVLAHASLVAEMTGITPLLLLDEVVAHLDPGRRSGAVRRTGKTRRPGLDDRRRPRGIHRHRRDRARFSTSIPARSPDGATTDGAPAGGRSAKTRIFPAKNRLEKSGFCGGF